MSAPPILDFARFYSSDPEQKAALVDEVINCCLHNGFFQITGHLVPLQLQSRVLQCSKRFFKQPLDEKRKVSKELNTWNRGYEFLGSQILEAGTEPELKEGITLARIFQRHIHTSYKRN
ncbi:1-aminocyclopropane-1-carboxylate oxidase [Marssonina coronariae]|uniref:1-aminocyclopropane-1-carboxylate oxidase n=1 Tax=Diplocarpon coronariae TaxID=2795749 RepID=A0A218ZFQ2_9HELO|nr:1-aminocyclopropane-1-carboxylate oxidase [Marssonina coronariae]